jgi:hypothetical protein
VRNLLCAFASSREQKEVSRKDAKTPRGSVYVTTLFVASWLRVK